MNDDFKVADILHFREYVFTDTNETAVHYALVLLPSAIMEIENNLLCAVITSQKTKYLSLLLSKIKYTFFKKDSYACFNRRDINCLSGLSNCSQPVGRLDTVDIKKSFKLLKQIFYGNADKYLIATIVREWKIIKTP